MSSRWRARTGWLALVISAVAVAGPRENVKEIGVLISDYYFDAQRAAVIVDQLKRESEAGSFDPLTDPDDLAVELTRRLRKADRHFNVLWEGPPAVVPRAARPDSGESPLAVGSGAAGTGGAEPRPGADPSSAPPSRDPPSREMQPVPPQAFEILDRRASYGFRKVDRLPGNIGYIELTSVANIDFTQVDSPARRAADSALSLVRGADAVILDVRENGGGSPSMVGYLVSAFIEPGRDVFNVFHSRSGTESERPTTWYLQPMLSVPVYVLTSGRTGSAAESIAYTLQTSGRAKVVGERSAGAANPGMLFRTPQGFAIFVSTGAPRNPINGRNWEGEGVRPDIEASAAHALGRAQVLALEGILSGPIAGFERTDAQWALDALRAQARPFKVERAGAYAGSYGPYVVQVVGAAVEVKRGEQPAVVLVPLQKDVFYPMGDPSRRYTFIRAKDAVVALEVRRSRGDGQRVNRTR